MQYKKGLWVLIDNLDKAWATHGLDPEDVVIFRSLLEAARKVERFMRGRNLECHVLIFIREDVFDLLVEETPDRGKDPRIRLDWSDTDLLREILKRRLLYNEKLPQGAEFQLLWTRICVSHVNGEESSEFLINRSLMRPRYLLRLINDCKAFAVNLSHTRIEEEDIKKGLEVYSTDCVLEVGLELRDVLPEAEDVLYCFVGEKVRFGEEELFRLLNQRRYTTEMRERIRELLLWHGVLGIVREDGEIAFIYDVNYDVRRLTTLIEKRGHEELMYVINPAFWEGLEVVH